MGLDSKDFLATFLHHRNNLLASVHNVTELLLEVIETKLSLLLGYFLEQISHLCFGQFPLGHQ